MTPVTLLTLLPEIVYSIAEHLPPAALNALVRSNRSLYHLLLRSLYTRAVTELRFDWKSEMPWWGTARQLELCLAAGLDPSKVNDPYEQTLLHRAWHREGEVVQVLLDYGADVNARDKYEYTPLHFFSRYHEVPLSNLRLLLQRGADVNAGTRWGKRPLHYAVAYAQSTDLVAVLLEFEADPNVLDWEGNSPLRYALDIAAKDLSSHYSCVQTLEELGDICRRLVTSGAKVDILGDAHRKLLKTVCGKATLLKETIV
jgi:ankyrin repeat protein